MHQSVNISWQSMFMKVPIYPGWDLWIYDKLTNKSMNRRLKKSRRTLGCRDWIIGHLRKGLIRFPTCRIYLFWLSSHLCVFSVFPSQIALLWHDQFLSWQRTSAVLAAPFTSLPFSAQPMLAQCPLRWWQCWLMSAHPVPTLRSDTRTVGNM